MNEIPHQHLVSYTLGSAITSPRHWWLCRASWRPAVYRVAAPQRLFVPPRESDSLMPPWTRVRRLMDNRAAGCVRRPSSSVPTRPAPALPRPGSLLTGAEGEGEGMGKGLRLGISDLYTHWRFAFVSCDFMVSVVFYVYGLVIPLRLTKRWVGRNVLNNVCKMILYCYKSECEI